MTPELDKYYQNRFSMMASDGWFDLMEDIKRMVEATNRLDGVDGIDQLMFKKGELSIMKWLLSLREVSEETYKELRNESD